MLKNSLHLIILGLGMAILSSCASTKKATIPTAWSTNVNWENFSSVDLTATEDLIIQNETDIYIRDGKTGKVIYKDVEERKGFFGQLGDQMKEQALGGLASDKDIPMKYWHVTLPESETVLLFDRSSDQEEIRSIDLRTGEELWKARWLTWSLEKYRDLSDGVVSLASKVSLGGAATAGIASEVLLQSRAVNSMIREVPEKQAFLFKTADGILHLVDAKKGNSIWQTSEVSSTGLASVAYLEDTDDLLIVGDMGGLKDIIKSSDESETLKQVYRIDAANGEVRWATKYKGRESQVNHISQVGDRVLVYFEGGSLEFFDYEDGERLFGTRDDMAMGTTRLASAVSSTNTMETQYTAMPIVAGDAVYAVNPTGDVNALALDDKQLVKFNYETGEVIWKGPVLEKTVDVRNMTVTDKFVIIQIPGAGNVVGGSKESGIYAFDKETGEEAWNFSEPISKKFAADIIYRDSDLLIGDGENLYQLNLEDGKVKAQQSYEEIGLGDISGIKELSDDRLALVGSGGFAVVNGSDLMPIYNGTVSGRMSTHYVTDDRLLAKSKKLLSKTPSLSAFDLKMQSKLTDFTLSEVEGKLYGNLASAGYMPINNMTQVLTITDSGIVSYDL